jgi:hypothetical protein
MTGHESPPPAPANTLVMIPGTPDLPTAVRRAAAPLLSALLAGLVLLATLPPTGAVAQEPGRQPADALSRNWTATTLEVGSIMALGIGIYIYKGERNAYDWPLSWNKVEERFTTLEQFRFDDNEFAMNNVVHPVAGAMYYRFARSNGFGPLGSSLWSIAGSTFWEVIVELREIASLNDLIATPSPGIAIGEAMHQHTEFFRRGAPGFRNSFIEKAFSGPILLNRLFGEPATPRATSLTASGLPADRAHRFHLYAGPAKSLHTPPLVEVPAPGETLPDPGEGAWMTTVGATSEITSVDPPDAGGVHETAGLPLTRLELQVGMTGTTPTEMDLRAEAVFDGWRKATLAGASREEIRGHRWLVGPATAFTVRLDQTPGARWMEMAAIAHVLGLRADGVVRRGPWRLRWEGTAYGDFSSIRPIALDPYMSTIGALPRAHSILWRNQYYYSYGATLRSRLEVDAGPVGLRGEIDHSVFEPFQTPHREEEDWGRDDLALSDRRTLGRAWLEVRPSSGWLLAAGVEERDAWGRMGDVTLDQRESRLIFRVTATP